MIPDCVCDSPGFCQQFGRNMPTVLHERCKADPHFRRSLSMVERPRPPCKHLGAWTGELQDCLSCSGRVKVKVFGCALHGTTTKKNCEVCPDRADS